MKLGIGLDVAVTVSTLPSSGTEVSGLPDFTENPPTDCSTPAIEFTSKGPLPPKFVFCPASAHRVIVVVIVTVDLISSDGSRFVEAVEVTLTVIGGTVIVTGGAVMVFWTVKVDGGGQSPGAESPPVESPADCWERA